MNYELVTSDKPGAEPCLHGLCRGADGGKAREAGLITNSYSEPLFSVGIHPWQTGEVDLEAALREIETAPVDAIGEIGLDRAVGGDCDLQKTVFTAQLRIAEERGLPVILHCVGAFEPVMDILAGYRLRAVIFHGFVGSREQTRRATASGYRLSFGRRSLASPKTVEAMRSTPVSDMFLETDEALTPIAEIYARVAEILGVSMDRLTQEIYNNYIAVFS